MRRLLAVAALLAALPLTAASGEEGSTTRDGMTLTVSKAAELAPDGERIRVRGRGYDTSKGIYVAFCVDNGPGQRPTPCGGGADTEGSSGNSIWISSFPPYYGAGLAQPYGEGGTFDVEISVKALIAEGVDCREVQCAAVTRADHTRSDDRSLDVAVPIRFAVPAGAPEPTRAATPPAVQRPQPVVPAQGPAAPAPSGDAAAGSEPPAAPVPTADAVASPSAAVALPSSRPSRSAAAAAADPRPTAAGDDAGTPLALLLVAGAAAATAGGTVLVRRRRTRVAAPA